MGRKREMWEGRASVLYLSSNKMKTNIYIILVTDYSKMESLECCQRSLNFKTAKYFRCHNQGKNILP